MIFPLVTALSRSAVAAVDPTFEATALTLGANRRQVLFVVLREARVGVLAACATAFGRVIGEVGVSMMLGGNIAHHTRTLTTAIALETSKGEFAVALALGIILLVLALGLNIILRYLQGRREGAA